MPITGGFLTFADKPNVSTIPHKWVVAKYNSISSAETHLSDDIAAILVEPMQGAGGVIPATKELLQFLRDAASEIGTVLIFDEIITSRLHFHGLQGYHGIYPDMTTLGKYLGGGLAFGAFAGRADIMALLEPGNAISHSGTHNNSILTMNVAITAAEILTEQKVVEVNALGDYLRQEIETLLVEREVHEMWVSGMGSTLEIHFKGEMATILGELFFYFFLEHNIYVRTTGFCSLNLMHDRTHVDYFLQVTTHFLETVFSPRRGSGKDVD